MTKRIATPPSNTFPASLVTVMRLAHAELRDLYQRQRTIRRRVSTLSRVLADLQSDMRGLPSNRLSVDLLRLPQRGCARGSSRANFSVLPDVQASATDPNYRLMRACRLALLELDEPETAEDIYSRIMRREAFRFGERGSAIAGVIRALDALTRYGQVRLVDDGSCHRWIRRVREEPPASQIVEFGRRTGVDRGTLPAIRNSTAHKSRNSVVDTDDRLGVPPALHRLISHLSDRAG